MRVGYRLEIIDSEFWIQGRAELGPTIELQNNYASSPLFFMKGFGVQNWRELMAEEIALPKAYQATDCTELF